MSKKDSPDWIYSFLFGALLGGSLALLLARQPGDKTRKLIRDISKNVKDKVNLQSIMEDF